MKVVSKGVAMSFKDLSDGDWYLDVFRKKLIFGMVVKNTSHQRVSFVFSAFEDRAEPWIAEESAGSNVLKLSDIELRPDIHSVYFGNPGIGDLVSADGKFFMRGVITSGFGGELTINLHTFAAEKIPSGAPCASFSRWSAGYVEDGQWITLFEYPQVVAEDEDFEEDIDET
jgi:hypothetical protein